jgi:uncharacterized protein (DUF952 family)
MTIYKIVPGQVWSEAMKTGTFTGSAVDIADGFIHFSTAAQVRETAARHFTGIDDLLLVAFPASALGDALRWEPSRGGALFPHLYAALPVDLALWVKPMPLDENGSPIVPALYGPTPL